MDKYFLKGHMFIDNINLNHLLSGKKAPLYMFIHKLHLIEGLEREGF